MFADCLPDPQKIMKFLYLIYKIYILVQNYQNTMAQQGKGVFPRNRKQLMRRGKLRKIVKIRQRRPIPPGIFDQ